MGANSFRVIGRGRVSMDAEVLQQRYDAGKRDFVYIISNELSVI